MIMTISITSGESMIPMAVVRDAVRWRPRSGFRIFQADLLPLPGKKFLFSSTTRTVTR